MRQSLYIPKKIDPLSSDSKPFVQMNVNSELAKQKNFNNFGLSLMGVKRQRLNRSCMSNTSHFWKKD